jgi:hypothetical protein
MGNACTANWIYAPPIWSGWRLIVDACVDRMERRTRIPTQHTILVSTGWKGGFGFLHSTKFLLQQDGKTNLNSYKQHKILVRTGWEGGFGFLISTKFLLQQDGKTDLDSYTAQNSCYNRMGRRIWIFNQHTILVST